MTETVKTKKDPELYARIFEHPLDQPGDILPFTKKLAQKQNWTSDFAVRVVREYRRFVYLAMVSGEMVTPSQIVDEAWHLHLTYTKDYWDVFCPKVLGKPLHHTPGNGSDADDEKHLHQYQRTLALYESYFGGPAPVDIWPRPFVSRYEIHTHETQDISFSVSDIETGFNRRWASIFASIIVITVLACLPKEGFWHAFNVLDYSGPVFLLFYLVAIVLLMKTFSFANRIRSRFDYSDERPAPDIDLVDLAYLEGGPSRAVGVELLRLCQEGKVTLSDNRMVEAVQAPEETETLLGKVILRHAKATGKVADLRHRDFAPALRILRGHLVNMGLIAPKRALVRTHSWLVCIGWVLFWIGVAKMFVGIVRDHYVFFLVVMLLVYFLMMVYKSATEPAEYVTNLGRKALDEASQPLGSDWQDDGRLQYRFARYGSAMLEGSGWAFLGLSVDYLNHNPQGVSGGDCGGGSSCGSSCGGGCGGGCGGCSS